MSLSPPRARSPRPTTRPAARATAWLLSGGAVGVALTTAAEVLTAPYGEAATEALIVVNPAVHLLKIVAVTSFAVGLLGPGPAAARVAGSYRPRCDLVAARRRHRGRRRSVQRRRDPRRRVLRG